jgi:hypothetical protein
MPFDLAAAVWRVHPLRRDPATDLSLLLTAWPRKAAVYAVAIFVKKGHLEAGFTSQAAAERLIAARGKGRDGADERRAELQSRA